MKEKLKHFYQHNKKMIVISLSSIFLLAMIGYLFILFGGKMVVKEEDFILDAVTTIETPDGEVIHELYNEKRYPVKIKDIPAHVQEAFIAVEDVRFYEHAGVDFKSVLRAVIKDVISMSKVEGASTITQQLSKNLFLQNDKTWMRKTKEVMAAIYLERNFPKADILEMYLNKVYFGHGAYGIEAAARLYFSKSVSELSIAEGALLAGIMKSPSLYSPIDHPEASLKRRNIVLQQMYKAKMISNEILKMEQGKTLGLKREEGKDNTYAASYIDLVIKEAAEKSQLSFDELKRGGYRIVVHLDQDIQQIAYDAFKEDAYFPGNTAVVEGSFVMMDVEKGRIVAAIGGRDYQFGNLNRVHVKHQPGSTMKPIAVYGPAMMESGYAPYSLIRDEELSYGDYTARNIDGNYAGAVTVFDAVAKSKNAPAVWLFNEIGINHAKEYLLKMGIVLPNDNGLAIALGGLSEGLTPIDLVRSYRSFAKDGKVTEPTVIKEIYRQNGELIYEENKKETIVFDSQVAWNMTNILRYTVESGTANVGKYDKELAGKTGSTQHPFVKGMTKDAWFVGYTPEYVTALWMGYDTATDENYLTGGSSYPTELTKRILTEIDKRQALAEAFVKPPSVLDVPKPIKLPKITNVEANYKIGIFPLIKGKISWQAEDADERIIYRIYQETADIDKKIGEVTAENSFIIDNISILDSPKFYIVPYDPNTKMEGEASTSVSISF